MIEIIKGRVNWMDGFGNRPVLSLLLSHIPNRDDMRFEKRDSLYFAESEGFCVFFSWHGYADRGFGGRAFPITMKDGSKVTLLGPWSSSASTMNAAGFGPCVNANVTADPAVFERGHTFYAGDVLISVVRDFADRITFPPHKTRSNPRIYPAFDGLVEFPEGSRFELASDSGIRGFYEPAVRLPDGTLWRKP